MRNSRLNHSRKVTILLLCSLVLFVSPLFAEQSGTIRGNITDKDFDAPLAAAKITIAETGQEITATDEGNFVFGEVNPGKYTVVIAKEGYARQVVGDVVVSPGQMTDVDASLVGEFTEMEEFVAEDLQVGGASEEGLLQLRVESPALLDSIGSELMSQAGVGDAASALNLVSGATVQDGKFAVVRGLPDRYVNSQMNGVRLPTADPDKRAVQLDQFPSEIIESVQVSKTFTPDQQGDASGGAVNVVLKSVPEETVFKISTSSTFNSQVTGNDKVLTSKTGGVNFLGIDDGRRDIPVADHLDIQDDDSAGVDRNPAPFDQDISVTAGTKKELPFGFRGGGLANYYYKRDSSYFDDGFEDRYWVEQPALRVKSGGQVDMVPLKQQISSSDSFLTSLFDSQQGTQEVQWGGMSVMGIENDTQAVNVLYMYTRVAEDKATLLEDTRGKETFDPAIDKLDTAPYLRSETLTYTERTTSTLQFHGEHTVPFFPEIGMRGIFVIEPPEYDWTIAKSRSRLYQPDKRQFGSKWIPESVVPAFPPFIPKPIVYPARFDRYKPAENTNIGNFQRIWKDIEEESDQYFWNWKLPFEQWSENKGYVKLGYFQDEVLREYEQESFGNFTDAGSFFEGDFSEFWSTVWPEEDHPVLPADIDVNYEGAQEITAYYWMVDIPVWSFLKLTGGIRYEQTDLTIVNDAEPDAQWVPPGTTTNVKLEEGKADAKFIQQDRLPAMGFEFTPWDWVSVRGSYTETVARQTFKELSPIQQQEYLGGDIFIGNNELGMSSLRNRDIRIDLKPYEGSLISWSMFEKRLDDPIEYVQRRSAFTFTTPVNFPKGVIMGHEFEMRFPLGYLWSPLEGLTIGGNLTLIDSKVWLPKRERDLFMADNLQIPIETRSMTNAPNYLWNVYFTWDIERFGTELGAFLTVRGDTLIAGAGQSNGNFIPDVYEEAYPTLNLSLNQKMGKYGKLSLKVKNLLNPDIRTIYRSEILMNNNIRRTSFKKGIDLSMSYSLAV